MPEIRPFRAWRYNSDLSKNIDELTSPLFDVVTEKQLEKLYTNPYASIHLSVPRGDNPAESAKDILKRWKMEGIIKQDPLPGIYVYYQNYSLPGSVKEFTRKGFIVNLRLHEWEERKILRHEKTIPLQVNSRIELLEKTEFNLSPTHGYYTDDEKRLEEFMDEAMKFPLYETEDYQGVRDSMAVIHDYNIIKKFCNVLRDNPVILADGHHRFDASLNYWRRKSENPKHTGNEGYNFHLMYLTNTQSEDIRIISTHRLIRKLPDINSEKLLSLLEPYFTIRKIEDAFMLPEVIRGKKWAFGLLFKENAYKLRLKEESVSAVYQNPNKSNLIDVSIAHKFIIDIGLGIPMREQNRSENIFYDRSFSDCYAKILKEEAQMAIVLNEVGMEDVKEICYSGYTLPQKTTFFFPKVISGFLYSSLKENEFELPFGISF